MDLVPFLSLIATGYPWLDHLLRVAMILFIVYSIVLNALVAGNPALKERTWVKVSLAIFSNASALFSKKPVPEAQKPSPDPVPFPPEAPTIPDRPTAPPPPEPPAAA